LIKDIPTCEVLLNRIEQEAEAVIDGLSKLKVTSRAKL
jgi:hypothetical protein